jgi:methyltransferase-like protein
LDLPPVSLEDDSPLVCRSEVDTLTATSPLTKAALAVLNERWPSPLPFDELLSETRGKLSAVGRTLGDEEPYRRRLAQDLLTLLTRRLLRIMVQAPRIGAPDDALPRATPLARWQATLDSGVTNRRHEHVKISDLNRCLLARLDGRHDRAALGEVLRAAIQRGTFEVRRDGQLLNPIDDATLQRIVNKALADLAASALLSA